MTGYVHHVRFCGRSSASLYNFLSLDPNERRGAPFITAKHFTFNEKVFC